MTELTDIKVAQVQLAKRVDDLEKSAKMPFYRDRRFWGGICAIPALILGGWTIDKLFADKHVALGLIHQAFGTQPVILDAIKTKDTPLRSGLAAELSSLFDKENNLKPMVQAELVRRFDILHAAILQLGLNRPDRIRKVDCGLVIAAAQQPTSVTSGGDPAGRTCEILFDAKTREASTVFGIRLYESVNIDIGVHLAEIPRGPSGELDLALMGEPTQPLPITELIQIELDETKVALSAPKTWMQYSYGGRSMRFAHIHVENEKLQKIATHEIFPLHTLTVQLKSQTPDNYLISVAVILTAPPKK